jgi:hypothetical protein
MKPHKSRAYLSWAKHQSGQCAVCKVERGVELHHLDGGTMGRKGTDFMVARVCRDCHRDVQGKRFLAFLRENRLDVWVNLLMDALRLVAGYAAHLEVLNYERISKDNPVD